MKACYVLALAESGSSELVDRIEKFLTRRGENPQVRRTALYYAARVDTADLSEAVLAFKARNTELRSWAVALGSCHGEETVRHLSRLMSRHAGAAADVLRLCAVASKLHSALTFS